ncbi:restriction endonuclease subunit S [Rosistilla oblonga]|uniref:restriction endonuclease subunit S n=1 Tax=Rosistilla oblonga TaxID=2527990 RepID=UPI003A96D145
MTAKKTSPAPPIRFPEFEGDWIERKGSEYFASSRTKGTAGLPIYSVTQNDGLVRRDSLDRQIGVDAGFEQNLRAEKDDLVYNMMRMWQGAVGLASESCMVSPAYVVLRPRKTADSKFFLHMFNRKRTLYLLWAFSYGLTNDRLRLYYKDFAQIPFAAPDIDEQEKIANFLGSVDQKIAHLETKRSLLMQYKKGVMQQMFSKQLRLKDDDGKDFPDWEETTLGEVSEPPKYGMNAAAATFDGVNKYVRITDIDEATGEYKQDKWVSPAGGGDPNCRLQIGDIVVARTGASVGKTYLYNPNDGAVYFAGFLIRFRILSANAAFINYQFDLQRYRNWVVVMSARSGQPGINAEEYCSLPIYLPSTREQDRITRCLQSFDDKIREVSLRITLLEEFKNGLLQQMFV